MIATNGSGIKVAIQCANSNRSTKENSHNPPQLPQLTREIPEIPAAIFPETKTALSTPVRPSRHPEIPEPFSWKKTPEAAYPGAHGFYPSKLSHPKLPRKMRPRNILVKFLLKNEQKLLKIWPGRHVQNLGVAFFLEKTAGGSLPRSTWVSSIQSISSEITAKNVAAEDFCHFSVKK